MSFSEKLYTAEKDRLREMVRQPDWYHKFGRLKRIRMLGAVGIQAAFRGNISEAVQSVKENTYGIFEQLLAEEVVTLGHPNQGLENWDAEREPIEKIVIHHTSRSPGLSLERLNAMHLLRLYVPRYQSKTAPVVDGQGNLQPIYSGHFNDQNKQVFYAYHWLVRKDGQTERLLQDDATGWHAGNWETNCKSVAICIDDDLTSKQPSGEVMDSIADILSRHYGDITIDPTILIGHNEVSQTTCPGDAFLGGWKVELLDKLTS